MQPSNCNVGSGTAQGFQPCLCLCFGLALQITNKRPSRRTILHFAHRTFTEACTFIVSLPMLPSVERTTPVGHCHPRLLALRRTLQHRYQYRQEKLISISELFCPWSHRTGSSPPAPGLREAPLYDGSAFFRKDGRESTARHQALSEKGYSEDSPLPYLPDTSYLVSPQHYYNKLKITNKADVRQCLWSMFAPGVLFLVLRLLGVLPVAGTLCFLS